jgi:hypothetical protein
MVLHHPAGGLDKAPRQTDIASGVFENAQAITEK